MFDEPEEDGPLSHEPRCVQCGHGAHPYLPCGDGCECQPTLMPGDERVGPR
jgi:hypothetical protein